MTVSSAMPAAGSTIAQTYPPGDLPYVVEISRKTNAMMARNVAKGAVCSCTGLL
jgi:hypothetical protein